MPQSVTAGLEGRARAVQSRYTRFLALIDKCHREDDEASATDAYHRGREEGPRERGGDELVAREKRLGEREVRAVTDRAMRAFAEARAQAAEAALASIRGRVGVDGMARVIDRPSLRVRDQGLQSSSFADDRQLATALRSYILQRSRG